MKNITILLFLFTLNVAFSQNPIASSSANVQVIKATSGSTFTIQYNQQKYGISIYNLQTFDFQNGNRLHNQAVHAGIITIRAKTRGLVTKALLDSLLKGTLNNPSDVIIYKNGLRNFDIYGRLIRDVKINTIDIKTLIPDSLKIQ